MVWPEIFQYFIYGIPRCALNRFYIWSELPLGFGLRHIKNLVCMTSLVWSEAIPNDFLDLV